MSKNLLDDTDHDFGEGLHNDEEFLDSLKELEFLIVDNIIYLALEGGVEETFD